MLPDLVCKNTNPSHTDPQECRTKALPFVKRSPLSLSRSTYTWRLPVAAEAFGSLGLRQQSRADVHLKLHSAGLTGDRVNPAACLFPGNATQPVCRSYQPQVLTIPAHFGCCCCCANQALACRCKWGRIIVYYGWSVCRCRLLRTECTVLIAAANICTHCQPLENHMGWRCLLSICN